MRTSGILLPVASLPSRYGIGCFSKEAYEFVDRLEEAGQSYWQILPLGPTGYGDSPYQRTVYHPAADAEQSSSPMIVPEAVQEEAQQDA